MAADSKKNFTFYIKRISGLILLLALAAVFFFSAYSKLVAIEPFEWTFIDMGITNMLAASVVAHIFIGLEFFIALFLLFHIYLKQVTYPATIGLLVLLTLYLIILIVQQGNTGNCGCFGDWIYMNPLTAIWKNLGMIAACILLIYIYPVKPYKNQEWISAFLGMAALVTTFIMAPLNADHKPEVANEPIDLGLLYNMDSTNAPEIELRKGKHIVAFMSLTCPHCRKAAYLLHVLKKQEPSLPVYLILSGHKDNEKSFFEESKSADVPHLLYKDTDAFVELAGESVPAIYWVNNSVIERKSTYLQLDMADIKQWLSH